MNDTGILVLVVALSYLAGSIPFGLLLTKAAGLGDIRTIGSGNIGATNVLRTGNKKLAALTLLLDAVKGILAVILTRYLVPDATVFAAGAVFLGHLYPVWLHFKGGKGVATAIGVITALAWPVGIVVMLTWLAVAKLFRFSSLAALVAIGAAPGYMLFCGRDDFAVLALAVAVLVFWKHRENICRLLNGTESKIGQKAHADTPSV